MVTGYKQADVSGPLKQLSREGLVTTARGPKKSNNARRMVLDSSAKARNAITTKYFDPTTNIARYVSARIYSLGSAQRLICPYCTVSFSNRKNLSEPLEAAERPSSGSAFAKDTESLTTRECGYL
jgi:hypothetical protein